MNLMKIADRYLADRACCGAYRHHVRAIAGRCRELSTRRVNDYLKARLERVSTITAANERTILLSLNKYAWESGIIDAPIRGVMKIRRRRAPTKAWTLEQLRAAIDDTAKYAGRRLRSGAPLDKFLRAWIFLGYESGARLSDVMSFGRDHLDGDILRWTQAKTGDPIVRHLSKACLDAAAVMLALSPDGRVVGWACGKRQAVRIMRSHLDACGIGGTSKWLRRSGATHIEMAQPGKASLHLGHRTPTLAAQAYIDWGQVRAAAPSTPELFVS
jgi:integrase